MKNGFEFQLKQDNKINTLFEVIKNEYENKIIFPSKENIFKAFKLCPINKTKVVIFGQDPYYQDGVADGLAFSTKQLKTPASLQNIFRELKNQFPNIKIQTNDLSYWARQGVLLLNTSLTVEKNKPNSHKEIGWDYFIKKVIEYINDNLSGVIFVLWGNNAKSLVKYINSNKHHILTSAHPSPLSAYNGFFGNKHFIKINQILSEENKSEIDWNLEKK